MTPQIFLQFVAMLLTLCGLLISLFSIHLGTWLGQLTALKTKWELNTGNTAENLAAQREVRYGLNAIYNHVPYLMTFLIVSFALGVAYFYYSNAATIASIVPRGFDLLFYGFFSAMLVLTVYLLVRGTFIGSSLKRAIG